MRTQKIKTFLMFDSRSEEAMKFYTSLFERSEMIAIDAMAQMKWAKRGPSGKPHFP
jgi:predicted 3-demethylubiquinone-9 3-methyltransferase (glyoxalase superfamily)